MGDMLSQEPMIIQFTDAYTLKCVIKCQYVNKQFASNASRLSPLSDFMGELDTFNWLASERFLVRLAQNTNRKFLGQLALVMRCMQNTPTTVGWM